MPGLISLGLIAVLVTRGLSDTVFRKPPVPGNHGDFSENPTYEVGDTVEIEWVTNLDKVTVYLWQDFPPASNVNAMQFCAWPSPAHSMAGLTKFHIAETTSRRVQWTVNIPGSFSTFKDSDGKNSVVAYFALYGTGATSWDAICHYFNITDPGESERTSTTSEEQETSTEETADSATPFTTEATTEGSSTSAQTTDSGPTPAVKETASPDGSGGDSSSDTGLSAGTVAGISIGSTIGVLLLAGAVVFLIWRRRRSKPQPPAEQPSSSLVGRQPTSPPAEKRNIPSQLDSQALHEMHSSPTPATSSYAPPPAPYHRIPEGQGQHVTAYELSPGNHGVLPGAYELQQGQQPPQSYELHHDYIPPEMEGSRPSYQSNPRY